MSTIISKNDTIVNGLQSMFNEKLTSILINISEKYDIDQQELFDCYLNSNFETKEKSKLPKKYKKHPVKSKDDICIAKKSDGLQCTRKKKDNIQYCGKHSNNQRYGTIELEDNNIDDNDKYIMTWTEQIDGVNYLIDSNNIVYSSNIDNPEILGKKSKDGKLTLLSELN